MCHCVRNNLCEDLIWEWKSDTGFLENDCFPFSIKNVDATKNIDQEDYRVLSQKLGFTLAEKKHYIIYIVILNGPWDRARPLNN